MDLNLIQNNFPQSWALIELKDLVENPKKDIVDGPFGSNLKANEYRDSGIPVFKIQNIKANQFINKNINYIKKEKAKELHRHSFKSGDLIITKLGDPLGLCCKVPDTYSYGIIVADLMRFRPSIERVFDKYIIYAINSFFIQNQFKAITKGTTRPRVNLTIVRNIKVPYPPLPEQHRIVSKN
jgi:type I restriction enzyme S subunit